MVGCKYYYPEPVSVVGVSFGGLGPLYLILIRWIIRTRPKIIPEVPTIKRIIANASAPEQAISQDSAARSIINIEATTIDKVINAIRVPFFSSLYAFLMIFTDFLQYSF